MRQTVWAGAQKFRQNSRMKLHQGKFHHRLPACENYEGGFVLMLGPDLAKLHLIVVELGCLLLTALVLCRLPVYWKSERCCSRRRDRQGEKPQ
jgi:hypothetical protein